MERITTKLDEWTESVKNPKWLYFRIDKERNRIYRKEIDSSYYGGCKISYVSLDTPLANSWINFEF